jgi:hypothetical protein
VYHKWQTGLDKGGRNREHGGSKGSKICNMHGAEQRRAWEVSVGTLQTGYPYVQASSQDKERGVLPHAATCPTAPDPTSQPRWAPGLPCVQRLRDPPLSRGGLRRRHVYCGSGPTGRALERRVSCGSGSCLPAGGLRAATRPAVPCGLRATSIKKRLAGLPVRQGPPVPNARTHVSEACDVKAIMSLQDVQAGSTINTCKTCGQTTTVQRRLC